MKNAQKILLAFLFTGATVGFVACSSGPSEEEMAQLEALKAEVATLQKEIAAKQAQKSDLQKQIAAKDAQLQQEIKDQNAARERLKSQQ